MKKIALLLLALMPLVGSAKKYTVRVDRPLSAIENASTADVELVFSPTAAGTVTYTSPEETAPLRILVNSHGVLEISTLSRKPVKISTVTVYYNTYIKSISLSGTGDVDASQINTPSDLHLSLSGTGDIEIGSVKARSVNVNSTGTGDVDLKSGKTNSLKIRNSGTGDVNVDIKAMKTTVELSGTGDVDCRPAEEMSLKATGTGDIEIKGKRPAGLTIKGDDRKIRFKK